MKIVFWVVMVPVAVLVTVSAIANRGIVAVDLWPFPFVVEAPIFALVLLSGLAGFLVGAFVAWVSGGKARRRVRLKAAEADARAGEADRLKERIRQLEAAATPAPEGRQLGSSRDAA